MTAKKELKISHYTIKLALYNNIKGFYLAIIY